MNPCQDCQQPATIHYTSIVGKSKVSQHLCEACARERGIVSTEVPTGSPSAPTLNLQALVAMILGQLPKEPDPGALKCRECGLKYAQFRAEGRLGCADDYDAFAKALVPLLERVHRDTTHAGKVPRSRRANAARDRARDELRAAIAEERYEDAARWRDELRQFDGQGDATDGPR